MSMLMCSHGNQREARTIPRSSLFDAYSDSIMIITITQDVQEATRKGLELAPNKSNSKAALQAISTLRGIGPATASAVLAPVWPDRFPFMADEAMEGSGVDRTYTEGTYMTFAERLQKKAQQLGGEWDAEAVGRALWTAAMMEAHSCGKQPAASSAKVAEHTDADAGGADEAPVQGKAKTTAAGKKRGKPAADEGGQGEELGGASETPQQEQEAKTVRKTTKKARSK